MPNQKKFKIFYESMGESGNIYVILNTVRNNLKEHNRIEEYAEISKRVQNADSYKEALEIISETAELVDISLS